MLYQKYLLLFFQTYQTSLLVHKMQTYQKLSICKLFILWSFLSTMSNCLIPLKTPIDDVASKLISGIGKVQYSLRTSDTHQNMDCLKISYEYDTSIFGIFHTSNSQTGYSQLFYAEFDNATGLWKNPVKLSDRGSQGTVMRVYTIDKALGFFVGYELENKNGNKVAIRYYENQAKLKINNFLYEYQLNSVISGKAMKNVGTPSLEDIQLLKNQSDPKFNEYKLNIKFHYCPDGSHDFPGYGYVNIRPLRDFVDKSGKWIGGCYENYQDWSGIADSVTEKALRSVGCAGKIGQRDFFYVGGQKYYLYECNTNPAFDWYSWKIALYSQSSNQAKMLTLNLGNDTDIANPHISMVSKSGNSYKFTATFFLPSQGIKPHIEATPGESLVNIAFTYP